MRGLSGTSLSDLIGQTESYGGNYGAFNRGGSNFGHTAHGSGKDPGLTNMTIAEIQRRQLAQGVPRDQHLHAVGKYQIIGPTLKGLMDGRYGPTGVKPSDRFTPEVQEQLGTALAYNRVRGRPVDQAMRGLRQEWIGLQGVPDAKLRQAVISLQRSGGWTGQGGLASPAGSSANTSIGTSTNAASDIKGAQDFISGLTGSLGLDSLSPPGLDTVGQTPTGARGRRMAGLPDLMRSPEAAAALFAAMQGDPQAAQTAASAAALRNIASGLATGAQASGVNMQGLDLFSRPSSTVSGDTPMQMSSETGGVSAMPANQGTPRRASVKRTDYGDKVSIQLPGGQIYDLIHGTMDFDQGGYVQGGWGPQGPNTYGAHYDIKASDGGYFSRDALDKYVQVDGAPLSRGVTVPGGQFGASRSYGKHLGWDYAFAPSKSGKVVLRPVNGAFFL